MGSMTNAEEVETMYNDIMLPPNQCQYTDAGAPVGQTDQGTLGDNGENEGDSPFAGIEEILKAVYKQEYTAEHLKQFRIMLVDDVKIFHDAEFIKMFPVNHKIWKDLLPGHVARFDFFRKVRAHPSYTDV